MKRLTFNTERDIKELLKFKWELNNIQCLDTCKDCRLKNSHCIVEENQDYTKGKVFPNIYNTPIFT